MKIIVLFLILMLIGLNILDSYRWWKNFKQSKNMIIKNVVIDVAMSIIMWLSIFSPIIFKMSNLYIVSIVIVMLCTYIIWERRLFKGFDNFNLSSEMNKEIMSIAKKGVITFEILNIIIAILCWWVNHYIFLIQ